MWRYPLLLLLASPLLYVAYQQGQVLLALEPPSVELTEEADLTSCRQELEKVRDTVKQRGQPGAELHKALLTVAEKCPRQATGSGADEALHPTLAKHARELEDVRRFFTGHADLDRGDTTWSNPFPSDHPYHQPLEARHKLQAMEQKIKDLRKRYPDDADELRRELDRYRAHPPHNRRIYRVTDAFHRYKELGREAKRDDLPAELNRALFPDPGLSEQAVKDLRAEVHGKLDTAMKQVQAFLRVFEDFQQDESWAGFEDLKPHRTAAVTERSRCEKGRDLLAVAGKDPASNSADRIRAHLKEYADLLKPPLPEGFRPSVRKAVVRFCESCLPPSQDFDDDVLLGPAKVRASREQVRISWKGKDQATSLKTSGFNEFTLKEKLVECFFFQNKTYEWPLYPTDKSKAAHFYNDHRRKLRWNKDSLTELLGAFPTDVTELADTRKRIGEMLAFFTDNPTFSAAND